MIERKKKMHNIPTSDVQLEISDKLFLGVLLTNITLRTIAYATLCHNKKKEQN